MSFFRLAAAGVGVELLLLVLKALPLARLFSTRSSAASAATAAHSSVAPHSGSKCRKPAKKISSPKVISRDFSCKFLKIFKTSVSGCLCYAFKICQIGAGTSKICQFNDLSKSHFWRAFEIWPDCVAASASPRWVSWTICFETRLDPGLLDYYIVVQRLWAPGCCVRGCWASKVHTYVHSLRSRCCSQRLAQEPRQRLPQCTHSEK